MTQEPWELEQIAREEAEARGRLEEARERNLRDDGVYEPRHHALIHKLEEEWKSAHERLQRARGQTSG